MKKILFLLLLTIPNTAMSYETAKYEVIKTISDKIEIRKYEDLVLATISANEGSENSNFRALFKFISGENDKNQEIKMTTPVFKRNIQNQESMSFVMPDTFNKGNAPNPNDKNIKINNVENQIFIVITFSGRSSEGNFKKYQEILTQKIKSENIKADLENPVRAYYNQPWTLPFLKRNEVLFKLTEK